MIQRADTIGMFQIESRAQMSMLPRLRPEKFYDLVIEVAIVRPGPIQGRMVHPYLQRRERFRETRQEPDYPSPSPEHGDKDELKEHPAKDAGHSAVSGTGDAHRDRGGEIYRRTRPNGLRRAMATFKRVGTIKNFEKKFIDGMTARGYDREFADKLLQADPAASANTAFRKATRRASPTSSTSRAG